MLADALSTPGELSLLQPLSKPLVLHHCMQTSTHSGLTLCDSSAAPTAVQRCHDAVPLPAHCKPSRTCESGRGAMDALNDQREWQATRELWLPICHATGRLGACLHRCPSLSTTRACDITTASGPPLMQSSTRTQRSHTRLTAGGASA
jgi:hypothetical protein